jgi:hypothetical protein
MHYLHALVNRLGKDVFAFRCGKKPESYDDIESILDAEFIQTCVKIHILHLDINVSLLAWLNQFRIRRGELAHGQWQRAASREEAVQYVEEAADYLLGVSFETHDLKLMSEDIHDLAVKYQGEFSSDRISELLDSVADPEKMFDKVCHSLLDDCRKEPARNAKTFREIWHAAYSRIEPQHQPEILAHAIRLMAKTRGLDTKLQDGVQVLDDLYREDENAIDLRTVPIQEEAFGRLFRLQIWTRPDLAESERNTFYAIIHAMLLDEIAQREHRDPMLKLNEDRIIAEHAPPQYQAMINQALEELKGVSHANLSTQPLA